jgi:hypothetical protein
MPLDLPLRIDDLLLLTILYSVLFGGYSFRDKGVTGNTRVPKPLLNDSIEAMMETEMEMEMQMQIPGIEQLEIQNNIHARPGGEKKAQHTFLEGWSKFTTTQLIQSESGPVRSLCSF